MEEKLLILDPAADPNDTYDRVLAFMDIFAFRVSDGIITRARGGPRDWTTMKGPIKDLCVIRHLLADRLLPVFPPQWIGSRSYTTTDKIIFDIDADRPQDPILGLDGLKEVWTAGYRDIAVFQRKREAALSRARKRKPLAERLLLLFDALHRMGVNSDNPREMLICPTPSGGMHVYVFLKAHHFLSQITALLHSAGLRHVPGQLEFFPSEQQALRLPFGYVPGRKHNPRTWINFVNDYVSGRIWCHSLPTMNEKLFASRYPAPSDTSDRLQSGEPQPLNQQPSAVNLKPPIMGIPKRQRLSGPLEDGEGPVQESSVERFLDLVERGPKSTAEAQELFDSGILLPGTRTEVLKHLAIHLVWFQNLSAQEATERLTQWAMDIRHQSKDIAEDLAQGTAKVAVQIKYLCLWCERVRRPLSSTARPWEDRRLRFAPVEFEAILPFVRSLEEKLRMNQIHLFLHLLAFGKQHGSICADKSGREFGLDIKTVVRHWPGCKGSNKYKVLMDRAQASGLLTMIKDKWQPKGRKGRARTYRLSIPVADPALETMDYAAAMAYLLTPEPLTTEEMLDVNKSRRNSSDEANFGSYRNTNHLPDPGTQPEPLHSGCTGRGLGFDPSQRDQQQTSPEVLPPPSPAGISALPNEESGHLPADTGEALILARKRLRFLSSSIKPLFKDSAFLEVLRADPDLSPRLRSLLRSQPDSLSTKEEALILQFMNWRQDRDEQAYARFTSGS